MRPMLDQLRIAGAVEKIELLSDSALLLLQDVLCAVDIKVIWYFRHRSYVVAGRVHHACSCLDQQLFRRPL